MKYKNLLVIVLSLIVFSCNSNKKNSETSASKNEVKIVGAMKDVMWKGKLDGKILLDTISNKKGLYGLGPESFLTGEILINNGTTYTSKVLSDSTMIVEKSAKTSAPFFVYANSTDWKTMMLPKTIKSISDLETFITSKSKNSDAPFVFKLSGTVNSAEIHIQNLPKGTKVSSPKEAHQGQINYMLDYEAVDIIGFYSTKHQGIFTHHDSFLHMHLITKDEKKMGHLDNVQLENATLFLPKS
ncbi:acetolactate decarboxylase [Winogradskyella sp. SYSU M77433]|uniref:acetolactate decarboxylase n=1 Tax=Winogradskyella sp. SYSU M77433 TaxID=3042722 RepID=UPI002480120B|nr:acetolactate decarboxylase [Winogradskyella sp. SYSU M77433]MDH7914466.1 acetolactate decarboxylase [Winogradskyella sp. SYSU M77433]